MVSNVVGDAQPQAGQIKNCLPKWETLTSDPWVLDAVEHCHIEFDEIPEQIALPREIDFSEKEKLTIDSELTKLLNKGVIEKCEHSEGEFISNVFLRPKKDGHSHRLILNLRKLNQNVTYHHFKMDTLASAIKLMRKGCFMASVDLRDAYYSVPIAPEHRKYLRFLWHGEAHQFTVMPNGLACAPRKFSKIMKVPYSVLRKCGYESVGYIDDSLLVGDSAQECQDNVDATVKLFTELGFMVHLEKSVFTPTQILVFLGFLLNSLDMTVRLTKEKIERIKALVTALLQKAKPKIRDVAQVTGVLVSSFPGVMYGPLHYRGIETNKSEYLAISAGNFEAKMVLSPAAKTDLQWWLDNVETAYNAVSHGNPDTIVTTDASKLGWGAVHGQQKTGGVWSPSERTNHINYLELLAVFFGLRVYCKEMADCHVQIKTDNRTACAYINNMGGCHSVQCNELAKKMWQWCIDRNLWISAVHIPGIDNTEADQESRKFTHDTEWMLDTEVFEQISQIFGKPDCDIFASRLNTKLQRFVSWKPDPEAEHTDAFSFDWHDYGLLYMFPPFSLIPRVLRKIEEDQAEAILIAPLWTTQYWFPGLMRLLVNRPVVLPRFQTLLTLAHKPGERHPLRGKLNLIACRLSGNLSKTREFQRQQPTLSCSPGESQPRDSMCATLTDGLASVVKNRLIRFDRL